MTMRIITAAETGKLEQLIDSCGLASVLLKIGEICEMKAEHIRESYDDGALARHWDYAASAMAKAADDSSVAHLSE